MESLQNEKQARLHKAETIGAFIFELHEKDGVINAFDERLWYVVVESVTVLEDKKLIYRFKNIENSSVSKFLLR